MLYMILVDGLWTTATHQMRAPIYLITVQEGHRRMAHCYVQTPLSSMWSRLPVFGLGHTPLGFVISRSKLVVYATAEAGDYCYWAL